MTDAELVARAQAGDRDAFGELVLRYGPTVRRLTRAVLRHPDDADDAAQDAFLSAWRRLGRFDPGRPLGPWLVRIAVNAARDLGRRQRLRSAEPLPEGQPAPAPAPDQAADRALLRERLAAALAKLPERQRLVVLLFDGEGYSHAEIAELVGAPPGTVRSDLFHARRALRDALGSVLEREE
ncbi:MAG TPA: sigma-70 family RNA polymerase sigma factor [Gemmatimonadales bacterium]|jgi:RNA polymerase sigma-70 factor (ECF subfamily)|nr:sigma-70 family RNA polymerase sigma factor [Gemmatimonadales bacterium]